MIFQICRRGEKWKTFSFIVLFWYRSFFLHTSFILFLQCLFLDFFLKKKRFCWNKPTVLSTFSFLSFFFSFYDDLYRFFSPVWKKKKFRITWSIEKIIQFALDCHFYAFDTALRTFNPEIHFWSSCCVYFFVDCNFFHLKYCNKKKQSMLTK